jgi:hypothetical protein
MLAFVKPLLIAAVAGSTLLAAVAGPASAQTSDWRYNHHAGRWHGSAAAGSAYGHAHYRDWPYAPGQDRVDDGPGHYEGYGFNSHNTCYLGETMYNGC